MAPSGPRHWDSSQGGREVRKQGLMRAGDKRQLLVQKESRPPKPLHVTAQASVNL